MKRLFFNCFFLLIAYIPVCLTLPAAASQTPGDQKVLREHKKIMADYGLTDKSKKDRDQKQKTRGKREHEQNISEGGGGNFLEWLQNLSLPVIILIIGLLALTFYLGLRRTSGVFSFENREMRGDGQEEREPQGKGIKIEKNPSFSRAMTLAGNGDLGRASIILHKASIVKLQFNHLLPPGEHFTNNQVKGILKSQPMTKKISSPFGQLATAAERMAFKGLEPGQESFDALVRLYRETFLYMAGEG